jgi:hypothetical protein
MGRAKKKRIRKMRRRIALGKNVRVRFTPLVIFHEITIYGKTIFNESPPTPHPSPTS